MPNADQPNGVQPGSPNIPAGSPVPPVATPPAPTTSIDAFVLGVLSTPPPKDQA